MDKLIGILTLPAGDHNLSVVEGIEGNKVILFFFLEGDVTLNGKPVELTMPYPINDNLIVHTDNDVYVIYRVKNYESYPITIRNLIFGGGKQQFKIEVIDGILYYGEDRPDTPKRPPLGSQILYGDVNEDEVLMLVFDKILDDVLPDAEKRRKYILTILHAIYTFSACELIVEQEGFDEASVEIANRRTIS